MGALPREDREPLHCEVSAPQGGRGDPSERDADPEQHGQDEPGIDHHCRVEGEPETEGAHIRVDVVADPEQDTPEHEKYGEDDQGASFLERAIKREPRIADEIEDELLERVEDETRVNVEGRVGLDRAPDPHIGIEALGGNDADADHCRQYGEDRILDDEGEAVADSPVLRPPVP
jgi:hypothetical protein